MVQFSRLRIWRILLMCSMTSLCVSRTSADIRKGWCQWMRNASRGIAATYLSSEACPSQSSVAAYGMENRVGLRPLLLGPPLSDRETDHTLKGLESHVAGLSPFIKQVYGTSAAATQAASEMNNIAALPQGEDEAACKRAAVLFALSKEPELLRHFSAQERVVHTEGEASFSEDMAQRVLPFVTPRFLRHSCQSPDGFVMMCLVLSEMWRGERLGNWPRTTMEPFGC